MPYSRACARSIPRGRCVPPNTTPSRPSNGWTSGWCWGWCGRRSTSCCTRPRQTGKTSVLLALRDLLNAGAEGAYRCVYVNVEAGQALREDLAQAMPALLDTLAGQARTTLGDESLEALVPRALDRAGPGGALGHVLTRWSEADPKPLVLLIDEVDALVGDTLISVLRQLRAGYTDRPEHFPQSVVLCGVRDVRDYRIMRVRRRRSSPGAAHSTSRAKSLRLGDLDEGEVRALLGQHTAETGQAFTPEALDTVWAQTLGQPWLVNALAYEACFDNPTGRERARAVTAEAILDAKEALIVRRETHLDQLADKLQEARVRRVVEPLLSGSEGRNFTDRDLEYVRDLGLVAAQRPLRVANPIYTEVIPRQLTYAAEEQLVEDPAWYVDAGGALDVDKLLGAFQGFFREHSEHWVERFEYREAGPQLLLQAFLQRIVNSGGSHRARVRSGSGPDRPAHRVAAGQGARGDTWWSARCCTGVWRRRSKTE